MCDLRDRCLFRIFTSMASFNFNSNHLTELEGKLRAFIYHDSEDDDAEESKDDNGGVKALVAILQEACSLVRDTDDIAPDFETIVGRVDKLINSAVDYTYNDGDLCDFMPSFAHSEAYPELTGNIGHDKESLCMLKSTSKSVSTGVALNIISANNQIEMLESLMSFMKGKFEGGARQPHYHIKKLTRK